MSLLPAPQVSSLCIWPQFTSSHLPALILSAPAHLLPVSAGVRLCQAWWLWAGHLDATNTQEGIFSSILNSFLSGACPAAPTDCFQP